MKYRNFMFFHFQSVSLIYLYTDNPWILVLTFALISFLQVHRPSTQIVRVKKSNEIDGDKIFVFTEMFQYNKGILYSILSFIKLRKTRFSGIILNCSSSPLRKGITAMTMKHELYIVRLRLFPLTFVKWNDDFIWRGNYHIGSAQSHLGSAFLGFSVPLKP